MKEVVCSFLIKSGMTEKSVVEAMKFIEETAYKEGYKDGLDKGRKNGIAASIRAVNSIEKWRD